MSAVFLDIVAVGLVLLTSIIGMCKGFFATFLSLLGFVGTFVITYFCNASILAFFDKTFGLTSFLQSFLGSTVGRVVAVVLTFIATFILIRLLIFVINATVGKIFKGKALGGVNKFMGFIIGMCKGGAYILLALVVLNVASLIPSVKSWTNETFAQTYVIGIVYYWVGEQMENYISFSDQSN